METKEIIVKVATHLDTHFAQRITDEMLSSAKARGTGIAKRSPEYVAGKMLDGKAVIAVTRLGQWVGFCYIEAWGHGKFVANSGLIVSPEYRKSGVAKTIKKKIFELSRIMYPESKIFGLTTGLAVMKINSDLGYEPVTYSELTDDEEFWAGCKSCVNFDILMSKDRKNCMCTAMLYDPADHYQPEETAQEFKQNSKLYERFMKIKQSKLLSIFRKKDATISGSAGLKPKSFLQQFFNF
ncbi:MAG: GNAT family N-acetyltransferase [Bacteroidetes bacterium 24-39-8]|nr:MAG: GNAT family N-acetyltransferase [Sphingobacteriia bacterium 35-40-8]OYZ49092.1 MAG: GNAT family N-acetyltransferase [Bacteroidetes bacterium 24-39-8]OZA63664.1 MAG: GNAT family N-acetyltransferase [Sphingobacteriia bacterium 39-39-8]HQR92696.1 GNAT family N-acetyltransferase [Sediminibacterium sp.]HQS54961.1 GNAT family N-acetyltransferase [Sediminibacterium sp.]